MGLGDIGQFLKSNPFATAMAVANIGSQVMSYDAQKQHAQNQQSFLDDYRAKATQSAWEEFANNANLTELNRIQQEESINFDTQQAALDNQQKAATTEASALENGVSGNSLDSLLRGYERTTAINDYISVRNNDMLKAQTGEQIKELRAKAISYINTAYPFDPTSIVQPSIGANLLSGLTTGLIGFKTGMEVDSTINKPKQPGDDKPKEDKTKQPKEKV